MAEHREAPRLAEEGGRYTEGVCGDGAAILYDGSPVRVEDVVALLNGMERTKSVLSAVPQSAAAPLCARLRSLSHAVTQGRAAVLQEFTMRVPAEPMRDADLVLSSAASEIERLQSEIAEARGALQRIVDAWDGDSESVHDDPAVIARAALAPPAEAKEPGDG